MICASGGAYIGFIDPNHQLAFTRYDANSHKQATDDLFGRGCARYIINDDRLVLRQGKQKVKIVRVMDDVEFLNAIGKERDFPGIAEWRSGVTNGTKQATEKNDSKRKKGSGDEAERIEKNEN